MNQPWIYMYSPSWSPLPRPSPPHSPGSSQWCPESLWHGWAYKALGIFFVLWLDSVTLSQLSLQLSALLPHPQQSNLSSPPLSVKVLLYCQSKITELQPDSWVEGVWMGGTQNRQSVDYSRLLPFSSYVVWVFKNICFSMCLAVLNFLCLKIVWKN